MVCAPMCSVFAGVPAFLQEQPGMGGTGNTVAPSQQAKSCPGPGGRFSLVLAADEESLMVTLGSISGSSHFSGFRPPPESQDQKSWHHL